MLAATLLVKRRWSSAPFKILQGNAVCCVQLRELQALIALASILLLTALRWADVQGWTLLQQIC